jgi:hypothetical protein
VTVEVTRFKDDKGKEGSMAPMGDGLTKMLFDDGSMLIVKMEPIKEDANAASH